MWPVKLRRPAPQRAAHGGVDAVGADDQVGLEAAAVGEQAIVPRYAAV
jgi:hypothetical protein